MNKLKEILGGDTRQFGMIFALVALIVFFGLRSCKEPAEAHTGTFVGL